MTHNSPIWHLLPPDLLELQIGQIDLLMAMYPEEIDIDESVLERLEDLRAGTWIPSNESNQPSITLRLHLPITQQQDKPDQKIMILDLTIPLAYEGLTAPEEPPKVKVKLQKLDWMNKATTTNITKDITQTEDLLETIDFLKDACTKHLDQISTQNLSPVTPVSTPITGPLVRVWFYFPSISTRSKRDDFILHAPTYSLTGFLFAGKPGILCVEGSSQSIDDYMRFIKTESWGDIPASHKKVSERYRETLEGMERAFEDMREITDSVGERRGVRGNRGDMGAVGEWLGERGLGDVLGRVLMGG